MQLADFALGQSDNAHAREFQLLVEGCHVSLIAADPVQRLRQQDFEVAALRVPHKPLDAGTQDCAGAG